MKRAALYARYSSDLQNDRSVDDQLASCRAHAEKLGASVVAEYYDRARSGASIVGRDGMLTLLDDSKAGRFDIVVVEALDRVSRDQEDLAAVFKRLTYAGIDIVAIHEGTADVIQIGIRGLVGQLFLQDLKHKTRRGLAGVVADGRHPGGRAYGYKTVPGEPGKLVINEDEAEVIRRIFDLYAKGTSSREIAYLLNDENVPAPRGVRWTASAINGNPARGYGILLNPIYIGEIVWNRVSMVRNPDTGKRVSRVNPESDWVRKEAPELQIVDRALYEAVNNRRVGNKRGAYTGRRPRRDYLLKGLMTCASCGGRMHLAGRKNNHMMIECGRAKETGTCGSRRKIKLELVNEAVLKGIKENLDCPEAIAEYIRTYNEERQRLAQDSVRQRSELEKKLARETAATERLLDLYTDGDITKATYRERVARHREEINGLEARLAGLDEPPKVVTLHPAVIKHYRENLQKLSSGIAEDEVKQILRELIHEVKIDTTQKPAVIWIEGRLSALMAENVEPFGGERLVAGEELEPPTRGF